MRARDVTLLYITFSMKELSIIYKLILKARLIKQQLLGRIIDIEFEAIFQGSQLLMGKSNVTVQEADISGYLQIKRKIFWVIRYAEILNGAFYYYFNKGDLTPRNVFQLRGSQVKDMTVQNGEFILQFISNSEQQSQTILIRCDKQSDRDKWFSKIHDCIILANNQHPKVCTPNDQSCSQIILQDKFGTSTQFLPKISVQENVSIMNASCASVAETKMQRNILSDEQQPPTKPREEEVYLQDDRMKLSNNTEFLLGDSLKASLFTIDLSFITEQSPLIESSLSQQQEQLSLREQVLKLLKSQLFSECNVTNDVDKDMRLICSHNTTTQKHEENLNHDKRSGSILIMFKTIFSSYTETLFGKLAGVLASVMIAMVVYQVIQILNLLSLFISAVIAINFIILPLIMRTMAQIMRVPIHKQQQQGQKRISKKRGVIVEFYFPHSINEFLFALTRCHNQRKQWQIGATSVTVSDELAGNNRSNTITISYENGEKESFKQAVFLEENILYIVEYKNNFQFIRIFAVETNSLLTQGFNLKLYFFSSHTKFRDMASLPNSPYLLRGLNLYLKQLKRNPLSPLFTYFQQSLLSSSIKQEPVNKTRDSTESKNGVLVSEETTSNTLNLTNELPIRGQITTDPIIEEANNPLNDKKQPEIILLGPQNSQTRLSPLQGENGSKYNEKIEESLKLMQTQILLNEQNGWILKENKPEYKSYAKVDESTGNQMTRGETTINRSAGQILDFIRDSSTRKTWDEMYKEGNIIEIINENTKIERNVFKGIFPVSDREMCLLITEMQIGTDYFIIAFSVEHPSLPERKKPVRASLKIGGWMIHPLSENQCLCVYLSCYDPNGNLVQKIKDFAAIKQGIIPFKLKQALLKK